MEENVTDHIITFISCIPAAEENALLVIRHWKNLQVAFDGDTIWIKGFSKEQAFSPLVKQIPFMNMFEQREGLLFKTGKLVPERKIPGGLLWNQVQRAYPVSIGDVNHNLFDIQQKIPVRILPSETEKHSTALLTDSDAAKNYITQTAAIRHQPVYWCLIGDQAFFTGTPLLSIPGTAYWYQSGSFIPAGYDFEFPLLAESIHRRLDPEGENKIIWFTDSSYVLLPAKCLVPLSISSVRLSIK